MGKNLVWDWVEDFQVVVHTSIAPSIQEWDAMIASLQTHQIKSSLVYTEGGTPSAIQRKQLRDAIGQAPVHTAVLTDSAIARAAITALNLFLRNPVRAFPINDLDQALQYTQVPTKLWPDMKKLLSTLKQQISTGM